MRIIVTVKELIDKGVWEEFCKLKRINVHALNEGLVDSYEDFLLTKEDAKILGFIM